MRGTQTGKRAAEPSGDRDVIGEVDEPLRLDLGTHVGRQLADTEKPANDDAHQPSMTTAPKVAARRSELGAVFVVVGFLTGCEYSAGRDGLARLPRLDVRFGG